MSLSENLEESSQKLYITVFCATKTPKCQNHQATGLPYERKGSKYTPPDVMGVFLVPLTVLVPSG